MDFLGYVRSFLTGQIGRKKFDIKMVIFMTKFEFQRMILKQRELRFGDKKLSTFQIGSQKRSRNVDKSETSPYVTKMSIHCI